MFGWLKKIKKDKQEELPADESPQVESSVQDATDQNEVEVPAVDEKGVTFFAKLQNGLAKTRDSFVAKIDVLFMGHKEIDAALYDKLEEILITADLGVGTTQDLLEEARKQMKRVELQEPSVLRKKIRDIILGYLQAPSPALAFPDQGPFVVMVVGVNGVGKTTTIGKMASKFKKEGYEVLLAAADTFRAAASEQLQIWGDRLNIDVVAHESGADPSSVVYDALDRARSKKIDIVLIDTAGRLHTKINLMEELKKIRRVVDKKMPGAPHEVLLVLDATTGQNGISQTKLFNEAVGVTGLALTKLDGTAKGGILINLVREFQIPVRFIGVGEQIDDLRDFDAGDFVDALFVDQDQHS